MREVKPTMDPRRFRYSTIYFKKARAVTGLKATGLTKFATENMFGRCVYEFVRGIARLSLCGRGGEDFIAVSFCCLSPLSLLLCCCALQYAGYK